MQCLTLINHKIWKNLLSNNWNKFHTMWLLKSKLRARFNISYAIYHIFRMSPSTNTLVLQQVISHYFYLLPVNIATSLLYAIHAGKYFFMLSMSSTIKQLRQWRPITKIKHNTIKPQYINTIQLHLLLYKYQADLCSFIIPRQPSRTPPVRERNNRTFIRAQAK